MAIFGPGIVRERFTYACVSLPDVSAPHAQPDVLPRRERKLPHEPAQPRLQPIPLPAQIPGVTDITLNPALRSGGIAVDFRLAGTQIRVDTRVLVGLAAFPGLPSLTLLSPRLPWAITVHASNGWVTVGDVLQAIRQTLELRITQEDLEKWRGDNFGEKIRNGVSWRASRDSRKEGQITRLDMLERRTRFGGLSESEMGCEDVLSLLHCINISTDPEATPESKICERWL
ncbi:hypothetical protein B0H14DRAFT_3865632 [Mycena olivaceomarginata]|nr:hypothetical protein B0H14DRAFT_3865632 [Mycena olivaceomarginata]